ncbi:hypothetical protein VTO73DRAFT_9405 [Trametes versicolor]
MTSPLCISLPLTPAYGAAPRASVARIPHPAATPTYRIAQPPSIYPLAFPASHHLASCPHPSFIFIPPSACPLHQRGEAHTDCTHNIHIYIHMHTHTPASAHGHLSLSTPFSPFSLLLPAFPFPGSPSLIPLSSPLPPLASLGLLTTGRGPPPLVPFHLVVVVESSLRYRCAVRSCTLLSSNPKQKPSTRVCVKECRRT